MEWQCVCVKLNLHGVWSLLWQGISPRASAPHTARRCCWLGLWTTTIVHPNQKNPIENVNHCHHSNRPQSRHLLTNQRPQDPTVAPTKIGGVLTHISSLLPNTVGSLIDWQWNLQHAPNAGQCNGLLSAAPPLTARQFLQTLAWHSPDSLQVKTLQAHQSWWCQIPSITPK